MICLSRKTVALVAILGLSSLATVGSAQAEPYKLHAEDSHKLQDPGTQLKRTDVDPNKDPFDDSEQESLDAPKSAFQAEHPSAPPKAQRTPFNLNAQDEGMRQPPQMIPARPIMVPPDMGGDPDAMRPRPQQPPPPAFDPNDPDSSPDMQLAWDAWHRRVAATIFDRFNFFAKAAFKHSQPLLAGLSYQVTRDGHIINMNMNQKSPNILFNVLVYQSVKSLEGDMNILAFPQGSRRMVVPKMGTFTQNYMGQDGFKYQTNDKETIHGAQAPNMGQPGMVPVGMRPAFR